MSDRAARVPATDVLYDSLASSARLAHKTKTVLQRQITRMAAELDRADTLPARKGELLRAILTITAFFCGLDVRRLGLRQPNSTWKLARKNLFGESWLQRKRQSRRSLIGLAGCWSAD